MPNLIKQCGDIESNPGPILKEPQFCHINLRSITADGDTSMGTTKFQEFESFVAGYNFEIIGISETWLDNSIDNENIALKHYLPRIRRDRNRHGGRYIVSILMKIFPLNMSVNWSKILLKPYVLNIP